MNLPVLIFVIIAAIALVAFLIVRNKKDRKEFEEQLKNDYRKSKDQEGDEDGEKAMK